MSNEVELPDAVRREVNSAMQKVLEEESVTQWTNLRVTQSQRMTLLLILMNSRDIVKLIDLDCTCVLPHYLSRNLYYNDQTLVSLHYFNSAFISPITVNDTKW